MNEKLTERTLQEIERNFKVKDRYITSRNKKIFCPHVNGLVNICLSEFGFLDLARKNCRNFLESPCYSENTFCNEVDLNDQVVDDNVNSCRNAIMSLALVSMGYESVANKVIDSLKQSPLYDSKIGLFQRQYNPHTQEVNPLIITQTNLWIVLALTKLKREKEAREVLQKLEKEKYDESQGLFVSQDCRFQDSEKRFFSDDQALAVLAYSRLGDTDQARELMKAIIRSQLYDGDLFNSSFSEGSLDISKSSYKNGLCGIALAKLGFVNSLARLQKSLVEKLYDFQEGLFNQTNKDKTKIPDNSALALIAIEYDNLKHLIF